MVTQAPPGDPVCCGWSPGWYSWKGPRVGGRSDRLCPSVLTPCVLPTQILVHIGFLTEESGDVFSPRVLKGGPLGEMVQWADILATLYVLGHSLRVTVSLKELQR